MSLLIAAAVLEDIANGRVPEKSKLVSGALALETLNLRGQPDRDLLDAEEGLRILATGGTLDLDDAGRARSAHLAMVVHRAALTLADDVVSRARSQT